MVTLYVQLSDEQRREARGDVNRYFAWLALGKPIRSVTDEEADIHYFKMHVANHEQLSQWDAYRQARNNEICYLTQS